MARNTDHTWTGTLGHAPFVQRIGQLFAVIRGPDLGRVLEIGSDPMTIGSGRECDLVLQDEAVSRKHLKIVQKGGEVLVKDLRSRNGSFVHGARFEELWIGLGTEITIGRTVLKYVPKEASLDSPATGESDSGALVGRSPAMKHLYGLLNQVAKQDATVLIEGETGTGKELVAEEIHRRSNRSTKELVVFDCGAVARELLASALFGHEKGAFTGANSARAGAFRAAHGGTLFLDEIGELPLELQSTLLRALDKKHIRRLGTDRYTSVDVRVVAATNRDLLKRVKEGTFREDLFYRLAVVRLRLPPLRERPGDIELLVRHFARLVGGQRDWQIDPQDIVRLRQNPLHGNVRQLRNIVERAVAVASGDQLRLAPSTGSLPVERITHESPQHGGGEVPFREARDRVLGGFEQEYLQKLMDRHAGNLSAAAREAKLDRKQLRKLLQRHDIKRQPKP